MKQIRLAEIRQAVQDGNFDFYRHALTEGKKDGITPADIMYLLLTDGEIIEEYPERGRVLVFGMIEGQIPVHVVCEMIEKNFLFIPTMYVPDKSQWINYKVRKRGRKKS